MRQLLAIMILWAGSAEFTCAQLTTQQKSNEFQQIAALFSKRYSFLEWKMAAIGYDGLKLAPWLDRVAKSATDVDFFEICAEYVASFEDGHALFFLPSDFEAKLSFTVDFYSGRVRIDSIDRTALPEAQFPFQVGDELVSVDGKPAPQVIQDFTRFIGDGNPLSVLRLAAGLLTDRPQAFVPRAHEIGDTATIVVQGQSGASTYTLPWQKTGTPYVNAGPVPDPRLLSAKRNGLQLAAGNAGSGLAPYLSSLERLQKFKWNAGRFSLGIDALKPIFDLPPSFLQRLGNGKYDSIFSGTFSASGKQIGFMRLPDFEYFSIKDLQAEIAYFNQHTDGLIVDVMRNPGGSGCAAEDLASYLIPSDFHSLGDSLRVTWDWVESFRSDVQLAKEFGASEDEIAQLQRLLQSVEDAYAQPRGFTYPIAICGLYKDIQTAHDKSGASLAYTKPVMILVDELSASAAELFAAIMQDNKRALIYGMRTAGAGGAVGEFPVGFYMEASATLPQTILVRVNNSSLPGLPDAPYIENFGIAPDKTDDYMTFDNLLNHGKTFVDGFTATFVDYINSTSVH